MRRKNGPQLGAGTLAGLFAAMAMEGPFGPFGPFESPRPGPIREYGNTKRKKIPQARSEEEKDSKKKKRMAKAQRKKKRGY